jgi:hypothetical protein
MHALKDIPEISKPLQTEKGDAALQKTDIFRRLMWFGYKDESAWFPLSVDRVKEILRLNQEGRKPATLEINEVAEREPVSVLNSDLMRLDKKFSNKGGGRNKRRSRGNRRDQRGGSRPGGNRPGGNNPAPR